MSVVYGYCRVSTPQQNIDRQVRNIHDFNPTAHIVKETYSGRHFEGRKQFQKLLKQVQENDTIIFDDVSRMSRNAEEGFELYQELYDKGVNLVFLNQPLINTETYRKTLDSQLDMTGDSVDLILEGVNKYLMALAKEQIRLAFQQAQREVDDLSRRTKEGMITARINGKQIGRPQGPARETRTGKKVMSMIRNYNKDFGGELNDTQTMKLAECSRATFYKYKHIIEEEEAEE